MRDFQEPPPFGQSARMCRSFANEERIVQFEPEAKHAGLAPITCMRNKGIVKGELFAEFEPGITRLSLKAAANSVALNAGGAHEREHQRAIAGVVARKATVQKSYTPISIAVVHPVLCREFL